MRSHTGGWTSAARSLAAAGVVVAALALGTVPAAAITEVLDQQQLESTGGTYSPTIAQTFVAGVSGDLTRLRLYLFNWGSSAPASGTITVEIRSTEAGAPTGDADAGSGDVLASQPLDVTEIPALFPPTTVGEATAVDVVFEEPAAVVAGSTYAIVFVQDDATFAFWLQYSENETDGPYDTGQRWSARAGEPLAPIPYSDAAFQTYVVPAGDPDLVDLAGAVGDAAAGLDLDDWRSGGTANAFASRVAGIAAAIQAGDVDDAFSSAVDLRRRIDGCGTEADADDWIRDCDAQTDVRARLDALIDALTP